MKCEKNDTTKSIQGIEKKYIKCEAVIIDGKFYIWMHKQKLPLVFQNYFE